MMLRAYIGGVGVLGPGLAGWAQSAAVLAGREAYAAAPTVLPSPDLLPAAERRRAGRVIKLALGVAREATLHAGSDAERLASVFASSGGDGHNCHALCEALAQAPREVSPTRFANSVHNAAAGYWSIATAAQLESRAICAGDASFGAGLLEAITQVAVDAEPLLLVAYDTEYPEPLHAKRPIQDAFGVALVLTPRPQAGSLAQIDVSLGAGAGFLARIELAAGAGAGSGRADTMTHAQIEALRRSIPAARSLPLLRQLARGAAGRVVLDYLDDIHLIADVGPCP